jgi:hypothetical protein
MFDMMTKQNRPSRDKDVKRKQHDAEAKAQRRVKADRKRALSKVREQEAASY